MKRIIAAVVVFACAASIVSAATYSANVVGYNKTVVVSNGLTLCSMNFKKSGGSNHNLDEALGGLTSTGDPSGSDSVLVWNKSSQTYTRYWWCDGTGFGPDFDGHWLDPTMWSQATNEILSAGSGLWIQNKQSFPQELLIAGEAYLGETNEVTLVPGLSMLGNPYAAKMKIGSNVAPTDFANDKEASQLTEFANSTGDPSGSDSLLLWDESGQSYSRVWYCDGTGFGPDFDGHFLDPTTWAKQDSIVIDLGKGAWYQNKTTNDVVWAKLIPYTY